MRSAPTLEDVQKGAITFTQSNRPPLEDGLYEITVTQSVQNTNASAPASAAVDETYTNTRRFQVSGERFAVDATEITSVFPPQGSQGEYATVLPHIVFSRQVLPWERTAGDNQRSSWLALLLFDENDPIPELQSAMVGDLQHEAFPHSKGADPQASNLPDTTASYPSLSLEYGENWWDPCQIIDVPVALFEQIMPGAVDLPWMTHSRTLQPVDPQLMGLSADSSTVQSSVVVGNRLPDPNTQCVAHLVSIENMVDLLPQGEAYTPASISLPNGKPAQSVRLISLAQWRYRSVDPDNTFTGILTNLDKDDQLRVMAIKNNAEQQTASDRYVSNALNMGFTPVDHHTRQGSKTVSWYRGPFTPFPVPPPVVIPVPGGSDETLPIQTADEAVRYDPETGMMDISYASAWQIGRLLALQDTGFSQALARWKQDNSLLVFEAFERELFNERLAPALALTSAQVYQGRGPDMRRAVIDLLRGPLRSLLVPTMSEMNEKSQTDEDT